jgi:hypothetical protein
LPSLLYFLFSLPHIFFNSILASRTSGTFGFAPTHNANPSAKPKEPLFATAPKNDRNIKNNLNFTYFEKLNFII